MVDHMGVQMMELEGLGDLLTPEKPAKHKANKTCRYCGKSGLAWTYLSHDERWRLLDPETDTIHDCYQPTPPRCSGRVKIRASVRIVKQRVRI